MLYYINALTKHLAHISFTFKISLPLIRVIVASFLLYEYVYILYSIYILSITLLFVWAMGMRTDDLFAAIEGGAE